MEEELKKLSDWEKIACNNLMRDSKLIESIKDELKRLADQICLMANSLPDMHNMLRCEIKKKEKIQDEVTELSLKLNNARIKLNHEVENLELLADVPEVKEIDTEKAVTDKTISQEEIDASMEVLKEEQEVSELQSKLDPMIVKLRTQKYAVKMVELDIDYTKKEIIQTQDQKDMADRRLKFQDKFKANDLEDIDTIRACKKILREMVKEK